MWAGVQTNNTSGFLEAEMSDGVGVQLREERSGKELVLSSFQLRAHLMILACWKLHSGRPCGGRDFSEKIGRETPRKSLEKSLPAPRPSY